jgi:hypothetical protein
MPSVNPSEQLHGRSGGRRSEGRDDGPLAESFCQVLHSHRRAYQAFDLQQARPESLRARTSWSGLARVSAGADVHARDTMLHDVPACRSPRARGVAGRRPTDEMRLLR